MWQSNTDSVIRPTDTIHYLADCDLSATKEAPPGEPEQGFSFDAHGHRGAERCLGLGTRHRNISIREGRVKEEAPHGGERGFLGSLWGEPGDEREFITVISP
jgi:hypothetical protein